MTVTISEQSASDFEVPGNDPRYPVLNVEQETRRAVVDLIRGSEPTTVLSFLISRGKPMEIPTIAGLIDCPIKQVELTVEMLEEEDLCARIEENGRTKVKAFACYTERNT